MENHKNEEEFEQTKVSQKRWVKSPFWDLVLEGILFVIFCFCIAAVMGVIFVLIFGWNFVIENFSTIYYIMFDPSLFGAFILWVAIIKKKTFKEIFLGLPKLPEKGSRWFYYLIFITYFSLLAIFFALLAMGLISFETPLPEFWHKIYNGVIWAPISEEIYYRGYIYSRSEDIFGKGRFLLEWNVSKRNGEGQLVDKQFMTFEVTYTAIFSSIFFSLGHFQHILSFNPFALISIFIHGLVYCKARNDTNSLITGMILHGMWNFGLYLMEGTVYLFAYL
jgi:membrane protease YdiL (CAAX protease family)